jgi:hypothetical protein
MFLVVERKVLWELSEGALAYLLNSSIPGALSVVEIFSGDYLLLLADWP